MFRGCKHPSTSKLNLQLATAAKIAVTVELKRTTCPTSLKYFILSQRKRGSRDSLFKKDFSLMRRLERCSIRIVYTTSKYSRLILREVTQRAAIVKGKWRVSMLAPAQTLSR